MRRRAAFLIAVGHLHGMNRLPLHAFRQSGGDLGQCRLGGPRQIGIAGLPHLGQPQHQRLHLQPCEHLRRQGRVFGQ
jgi:hypothetical protein